MIIYRISVLLDHSNMAFVMNSNYRNSLRINKTIPFLPFHVQFYSIYFCRMNYFQNRWDEVENINKNHISQKKYICKQKSQLKFPKNNNSSYWGFVLTIVLYWSSSIYKYCSTLKLEDRNLPLFVIVINVSICRNWVTYISSRHF